MNDEIIIITRPEKLSKGLITLSCNNVGAIPYIKCIELVNKPDVEYSFKRNENSFYSKKISSELNKFLVEYISDDKKNNS